MHFALHLHGVIYKCVCVSLCLSVCVKSVHSVRVVEILHSWYWYRHR